MLFDNQDTQNKTDQTLKRHGGMVLNITKYLELANKVFLENSH